MPSVANLKSAADIAGDRQVEEPVEDGLSGSRAQIASISGSIQRRGVPDRGEFEMGDLSHMLSDRRLVWVEQAGVSGYHPPSVTTQMRRILIGAASLSFILGIAACSFGPHLAKPPNDLEACASIDAMYALINHHDTVPSVIARRVITSGESADNHHIQIEARAMQADVNASDDVGVEEQLTAMGSTCNSLGVGPSKY